MENKDFILHTPRVEENKTETLFLKALRLIKEWKSKDISLEV